MKSFRLFISASLLWLFSMAGCNTESQPRVKHVLVIGVDGLSPDGIANAHTPVMDSLLKTGSFTLNGRAVFPTSSSTNWATMMMGAGPEQHGITSNSWERDEFSLEPVVTGMEGIFPTIFGVIREQRPGAVLASVYDWDGFGRLYEKSAVNVDMHTPGAEATADSVAAILKRLKPDFTMLQLDHVDAAGHSHGHSTPGYFESVSKADSLIGVMIRAASEAGMEDLIVIICSDHGGIGYGHGGESPEEVIIPMLISGSGVKSGYRIANPYYQYDLAATVAFAMGLEAPQAWIGRPVKEAFIGFQDVKGVPAVEMIARPVITPAEDAFGPAGGLFNAPVLVKIENKVAGAEICYTTDGSDPDRTSKLYEIPFNIEATTVLKARAYTENGESSIATGFFRFTKGGGSWRYTYYEIAEGTSSIPTLSALRPIRTGAVPEARLHYIPTRELYFALRLETQFIAPEAGEYTFYTNSDDGSALWIGNALVVDNDGDHGVQERSGRITLSAGEHPMRVDYFQGYGGKWLDVYVKGPGIPKQILPPNFIRSTR